MSRPHIRVGQIDYLNVWPVFDLLKNQLPRDCSIEFVTGHPSTLNKGLHNKTIHLAPSSSFEYLAHSSEYAILPDLSISSHGSVQSVLLLSPNQVEDSSQWNTTTQIALSQASATSIALLKILWKEYWKLPEPQWIMVDPGKGFESGLPFLEIGNQALKHYLNPPENYNLYDLSLAWKEMTRLPFVFAVWIVQALLSEEQNTCITKLHATLKEITKDVFEKKKELSERCNASWLSCTQLMNYWQSMDYSFGPEEQASLILFGHYCQKLGLIQGVPSLRWFSLL